MTVIYFRCRGEDRWLCTLLLQQGYRVEYCAASDALTYAPEGFYYFFNQRRCWTPSTIANIVDLMMDWKHVTKRIKDTSSLYIAYQTLFMVSFILTLVHLSSRAGSHNNGLSYTSAVWFHAAESTSGVYFYLTLLLCKLPDTGMNIQ